MVMPSAVISNNSHVVPSRISPDGITGVGSDVGSGGAGGVAVTITSLFGGTGGLQEDKPDGNTMNQVSTITLMLTITIWPIVNLPNLFFFGDVWAMGCGC
jgi:hypothetical protein